MKKILSALISLSLLCALTACGGGQGAADSSVSQPSAPAQSQPAPSQPDASTEEPPTGTDSSEHGAGSDGGILIAYFSATGNTRPVADLIADVLDADLYEIVPEDPYTDADLNYNTDCRANDEQNDPDARPAISGGVEHMEQYDTILLGYPIWWSTCPMAVFTFLDSYDFTGKTVIPFCAHGTSGLAASVRDIRAALPGVTVLDAVGVQRPGMDTPLNTARAAVETWLANLEY